MKRWFRRLLIVSVLFVAGMVFIAVFTPQGRTSVRAALFITEVLPSIPIKPQKWVIRDPLWRSVSYSTPEGEGMADLVLPDRPGKHSAVLFFLGVVTDSPRQDDRVVGLAEGLARAGMVVMIPWSETQLQQRIVPEDIDRLVYAFQYLRGLDFVNPDRVGMGGICTGASMALVAAQDQRIRDDVKFVNLFAGYYDAHDFFKAISSRSRFYEGEVGSWDTDELTLQVFRNHLIDGLTDNADRELLVRIFSDPSVQEDQGGSLISLLSDEGVAVYNLVNGVAFEEFDGFFRQLSPETSEFLSLISPSTNIHRTKARILVMHDRADRLVPSEESRRLVEAVFERSDTYHTEFTFFQDEIQLHVDGNIGLGPLDFSKEAVKLFMHMYNIMSEI